MITFYAGTGCQTFDVLTPSMELEEWTTLRNDVCYLLTQTNRTRSAELLENTPFNIYHGTNDFEDEFQVLYATLPRREYIGMRSMSSDSTAKIPFREIADAFKELEFPIRFIAVELLSSEPIGVIDTPLPSISATTVLRALRDSQQLLATNGAVSAVDRVHTVLHGYLREICSRDNIALPSGQSGITALYSALKNNHPAFTTIAIGIDEIQRILRAFSTIIDSLNTLRNNSSVAHPNPNILDEAEAILAINCVKTLLHYFNTKLSCYEQNPEE